MKITVYTTTDCKFSKEEREYLTSRNLQYEEKNLETNKEFLTEMLAISNNFAGTPVTRIEKDDGTITVLKGFTKEEFDTVLGLTPMPAAAVTKVSAPEEPVVPTEAPTTPAVDVPPVVETPTTNETAAEEAAPKTPAEDQDLSKEVTDPLQSVMDNLKSKSDEPIPEPIQPTETPNTTPPVVDPSVPSIPDFPAK